MGMAYQREDSPVESPSGTSARIGKPKELWEVQCGRLLELQTPGRIRRAPQYCEFYLQELDQVITVNTGEKSPRCSSGAGEKEPF